MKADFTEKQREIVARKMGYDGPMQMFDTYLNSTPSEFQRFSAITDKLASTFFKGGMVKLADGGLTQKELSLQNPTQTADELGGAPELPTYTAVTAAQTDITPSLQATAGQAPTGAAAAVPAQVAAVDQVAAPTTVTAPTITAATSQEAIQAAQAGQQAATGVISPEAQIQAAQQVPTTTAVSGVQAAQGEAAQVVAPQERVVQAGELVSGPAVDQTKVEEALQKAQAAQGVVTKEMTVQGQLDQMLSGFDAGNPPPWAAGSMRAATAQLAARGLGASSLAGQAVIQAALESATPIAQADAQVFTQMGLQNLSNRQAVAILTAQQRAQFLGQEFDQAFQTRVLNAAKISDIANKNFDASVQIALQNSQLANTMNLANLNNEQAVQMAKIAQIATLETANLNNRQQAAVINAQSFLQMDMKNLDNEQQMNMLKSQQITQSILSDTAAENAAKATNATNSIQVQQLNASMALAADQFNASETNKLSVANMNAANELIKFNAQQQNARDEFNANMQTQINMANAKILADISTANTAAINAANALNAKNSTDLTTAAYNQLSTTYRDKLEMSFKAADNDATRINNLAIATINADATIKSAALRTDAESSKAIGQLITKVATSNTSGTIVGKIIDVGVDFISNAWDTVTGWLGF